MPAPSTWAELPTRHHDKAFEADRRPGEWGLVPSPERRELSVPSTPTGPTLPASGLSSPNSTAGRRHARGPAKYAANPPWISLAMIVLSMARAGAIAADLVKTRWAALRRRIVQA